MHLAVALVDRATCLGSFPLFFCHTAAPGNVLQWSSNRSGSTTVVAWHVQPCLAHVVVTAALLCLQVALLQSRRDSEVVQETRLWDETRQETTSMRTKEGLADYR